MMLISYWSISFQSLTHFLNSQSYSVYDANILLVNISDYILTVYNKLFFSHLPGVLLQRIPCYDTDFYPKNKTRVLFKGDYDEYKYAHSKLSTMVENDKSQYGKYPISINVLNPFLTHAHTLFKITRSKTIKHNN